MNKVQKRFIKDALDAEHKLNGWEIGFINSLADKDDDYKISDDQNEILNQISQKIQD